MRETRLSGLEGGGADIRSPYPYHRLEQGDSTNILKQTYRAGAEPKA